MKRWIPRDGEAFVTKEGFVYYVFGYEHPKGRVFSFLKYVPSKFKNSFQIRYLRRKWSLGRTELSRFERLYTAQNFQRLLKALRRNFPNHIYYCPYRRKEVISPPLEVLREVYIPRDCMLALIKKRRKDQLQKMALDIANLLSNESGIPIERLGLHGSMALNMHTEMSDIDLVVYGSQNFRILERTIDNLVNEGTLSYVVTNRLDKVRKHRIRYKNKIFVYNAVRRLTEITSKYGENQYRPVKSVNFSCRVVDDSEAMFRPAIYKITNYQPIDSTSELIKNEIPTKVVSMIGVHRNVARRGDIIKVSGTLERVEGANRNVYHQIVVGTGNEDEYLQPSSN